MIFGTGESEIARRSRRASLPFLPISNLFRRFSVSAIWRLYRDLRAMHVHSVIVNTSADLTHILFARLLARKKVRIIFVQHMQIGVSKRDLFHSWQYRRIDAWISPLPFLSRQVESRTRIAPEKIHEIPFGIELDRFIEQKPCRTRARLHLGLPVTGMITGMVGRLDPQKNQKLLLLAADRLIRTGLPVSVAFIGDDTFAQGTEYRRELMALADRLGIQHRVFFVPFLEEINLAYAALDIFVLTSLSETFGMVTVEAMAAGLPIIATRSGGTPEVLRDKQEGLLIEPDNAQDLEAALRLLVEFPELRTHFARAARRKALEEYSHLLQVSRLARVVAA